MNGKACFKCGGTANSAVVVTNFKLKGVAYPLCNGCSNDIVDWLHAREHEDTEPEQNVAEFEWIGERQEITAEDYS